MSWMQRAACGDGVDPNIFTPDPDEEPQEVVDSKVRAAKAYCRRCPVKNECLALGMRKENRKYWIFGGTTPDERKELYRDNPDTW